MTKLSLSSMLASCFSSQEPRTRTRTPSRSSQQPSPLEKVSSSSMRSPEELSLSIIGANLHAFTISELREMTQDFAKRNLIGKGGFGSVYKGYVDEGLRPGLEAQAVGVKLMDLDGLQGHKEWLAEVIFLGHLKHPNLVKLIGYCYEDQNRLLVYEFVDQGSLEKHLYKRFLSPLAWSTRLKIAMGAAEGLAFLHEVEKPIIYRDFKTSNVLLDADYQAKLSDFGLAKSGPEGDDSHVSTQVMGTEGYCAPEYVMTGHLTVKSDVYSFGVVLLELLTGRRCVERSRPAREQQLVEWARQYINPNSPHSRLSHIMDPSLDGQYSALGARKAAALAHWCLSGNPKSRPRMRTVVEALQPLLDLNDVLPGPFEFTVAFEKEKAAEKAPSGISNSYNWEKKHKLRFPNSAIHSDTSLGWKSLRNNYVGRG